MENNPELVREVENALHVDIIPGTEIMAQGVAGIHFVENESNQVLVPQPSNNPDDPLNWSPLWKGIILVSMFMIAFVNAFGPLAIAPQVPMYMAEWPGKTIADILQFIGVCILVLGFSNFIWVPMSTTFGRRWVSILAGLVSLAACIWRANAHSYNSMIGASILHGIGAGTAESIPPVLIADVMFLNERGLWMNVYTWSYFGALMVGGIVSGAMSDRYGWRSFWWLNVALYTLMLLFQVLLHPETHYDRRHLVSSNATNDSSPPDVASFEQEKFTAISSEGVHPITEYIDTVFRKGSPTKSQFIEFTRRASKRESWLSIWTPIMLFSFPIIEWSSFAFSWSASCYLMINLTQSQVFAAPPYNMSASAVGLTNFAPLIGGTVGMLVAGPLSDWVSMKATRKNKGIREPEMRLPTLIPFTILAIIGAFVTAYGYQNLWKMEVIVIVGYTLLGLQVTAISAIAMTYSIDSYKPIAGEILVSATVNKNLWGYGVSKFLTPWVIRSGYVRPMITIIGTSTLIYLFAIPLYIWGKNLRRMTKDSYVHKQ
ncbi:MFS transporter [Trichophaea hybrida]|nr:MFS transporter [Trichophaea hybrida]